MCKINGVYLIKNSITKRIRIGSATDIDKRFSHYKSSLKAGKGNAKMVEDVVNYGLDSFEFIILEECSIEDLFITEQKYMNLYSDCFKKDYGYNSNRVRKREKYIRDLEEAREYKEKRSKVTSGELNGHCTCLDQQKANEILWLKLNTNIKYKDIAELYGCSSNMVSRIMKDRWMNSIPVAPKGYGRV
ncbi:GIY-YIG nuclease family protein [Clostridium sp. C2-6-12]|uniref:GIY-YIG nuclease family protein n=1 Tax=Clostridium sp. C2-6-12 TaxID=2698832 RepID=UPI001FACF45B|nr:GIY-YIG nuclease family protein [Clostridium sp. C2-6-12]